MANKEPIGWITVNGRHIPIFEGESKDQAVNRYIAKTNEEKKQKDIARNKAQADKLNGIQESYKVFTDTENPISWFRENSNWSDWENSYESGLYEAMDTIRWYTSSGYGQINYSLYNTKRGDIDDQTLENIKILEDAISRFELYKGVEVSRHSDFVIFGGQPYGKMTIDDIKQFLAPTNGVVQNDAFMSFSADAKGRAIMGKRGLITHLRIPKSKGAGMYVSDYSVHPKEKEFILNDRAILKYDLDSIYQDDTGVIHIYADWLGQADKRTIDK